MRNIVYLEGVHDEQLKRIVLLVITVLFLFERIFLLQKNTFVKTKIHHNLNKQQICLQFIPIR